MSDYPNSLALYMGNRCNLSCSYCYVAVNRGRVAALGRSALRCAIDDFLARSRGPDRKITFLGGEPLIEFDNLRWAVEHVRMARGDDLPLHLLTNGILLTPDRLAFLHSRKVEVVLGLPAGNDPIQGGASHSLQSRVLKRIAPSSRRKTAATFVVTPRSIGSLLRRVDSLYRAGLRKLAFSPDITSIWRAQEIARLEKAMTGFRKYYSLLVRSGAVPFEIPNIYEAVREAAGMLRSQGLSCPHLILAGNGNYYPCDKMLGIPWSFMRSAGVGSAAGGPDLEARAAYFKQARDRIESAVGSRWDSRQCPVGALAVWETGDRQASLGDWMRGFRRVSGVFAGAMLSLARELQDIPAFRSLHAIERSAEPRWGK